MDISRRDWLNFLRMIERYGLRAPTNLIRFLGSFELCIDPPRRLGERSLIGASKHPLYSRWRGMMSRCYNPNTESWKHYGARGIVVEPRWHTFVNFIDDMNAAPEGASIDRIDVNGNYGPSNCRWANSSEQALNKRKRETLDPPAVKAAKAAERRVSKPKRSVARKPRPPVAPHVLEALEHLEEMFLSAQKARLKAGKAHHG